MFDLKWSDADVVNPESFIPAGEYNPHNVRPWLLHDHGCTLAVVFADCLQDAIDEAVDAGKLDRYLLDPSDKWTISDYMEEKEEGPFTHEGKKYDWLESVSFLGNASEPFDIESLGAIEMDKFPGSIFAQWSAAQTAKL